MNTQIIGKNSLPEEKKDYYSHLKMEDIPDADSVYAKRVYKEKILK